METSRKQQLIEALKSGPQEILYTHAERTENTLYGTLDLDLIPEEALKNRPPVTDPEDDEVVRFYNFQSKRWGLLRMRKVTFFVNLNREATPKELKDVIFPIDLARVV